MMSEAALVMFHCVPGTVAANEAPITLSQGEVAKMTYWHRIVTWQVTLILMVPTSSRLCSCTSHIAFRLTWILRSHFQGHIHCLGNSSITVDRSQGKLYVQSILWHPQIRVMVS
jgi:hypothetical protein